MQTAMMARFQTACFAMQILQTMAQVLIRRSSNRVEGRDTTPQCGRTERGRAAKPSLLVSESLNICGWPQSAVTGTQGIAHDKQHFDSTDHWWNKRNRSRDSQEISTAWHPRFGCRAQCGAREEDGPRNLCSRGGKADFILSDLGDAASAREAAKRAIELGNGHVDILINNAGIYPFGPTHEMTEEQFDRVFSLNVKAPYFLAAELAPLMAKRGKGAIVNLSTMVADYGAPGTSLYGASKAAINLLTTTWAAEYGPSGVRVNAVSPGPTRTEGTDAMGEGLDQLAAQAPAGRPATADEIADAIVFLATDRASFIYGAKLAVDGGRTAV